MKAFKIVDCIGQILLIVGAVVYNVLPYGYSDVLGFNDYFIWSYLLVGTWQIISLIIHFFIPAEYKVRLRRVYSFLLLITAAIFLVGLVDVSFLLYLMVGLLYWSPVLAILYVVTSLLELRKLNIAVS